MLNSSTVTWESTNLNKYFLEMVDYDASFDERNSGTEGLVEAGTTTSMFVALAEGVVAKL